MKKETLEIDGRTYTVSELKYKDVAELADLSKTESAKRLMQLSTELTNEEYDELSMSAGIDIMKVVNKLNNIDSEDFQEPVRE